MRRYEGGVGKLMWKGFGGACLGWMRGCYLAWGRSEGGGVAAGRWWLAMLLAGSFS